MKDVKLEVHAVLGEGNKLIFDIPQSMQEAIDVKAGDVLDLEQISLWHDIAKAHNQYQHSQDDNTVAEIRVPARLVENGEIDTTDLLQVLSNNESREDSISVAERCNLLDAIFNKSRAVDERKFKS